MPQFSVPFTSNPETVQVPDKQVSEDHINGLPVRVLGPNGSINSASNPTYVSDIPSQVGTATFTVGVAQTAAAAKSSAGTLFRVVITTTGTAASPTTIYDNASAASGTILAVIPANAAAGTIYAFMMPAANGIYVGTSPANSPAFTLSYA